MISRFAALGDKDQVIGLFQRIVSETALKNSAFMNWSEASVTEAWELYRFYLLSDDVDGAFCGFICSHQIADRIEILALGLLSPYQGLGFMKSFLNRFIDECGATSSVISLEVHSQNQAAIDLYNKCGFKTVRIRKNYYSDSRDALVMDLNLEKP